MKHLGDIRAISGYTIPPVDVVTGGSPCQDLSTSGKRTGLSGERSGLFLEQIRIVKELRNADRERGRAGELIRPRFMLWENVPGAFSSNQHQDFRAVLEACVRIALPDAPDIPCPSKWPLADAWYGVGWSLAYRVFDAQFWGVAQRRRRIALICDFGGYAAPEILFVREGVSGNFNASGTEGKKFATGIEKRVDPAVKNGLVAAFKVDTSAKVSGVGWQEELSPTLTCNSPAVYISPVQQSADYKEQKAFLRRLTPLECERLQGFPDGWTAIGEWTDSHGKRHQTSDAARYKALGNSIALPSWKWVLKRITAQYERDATLGSLFDGIGGFPLIWEQLNGKGSALWASEIEEFPMAVTRRHFGES